MFSRLSLSVVHGRQAFVREYVRVNIRGTKHKLPRVLEKNKL